MQGLKRRVTYIVFYELLRFSIISTIFFLFSSKDATQSGILAAMTVVLAIIWNFIFNMIFEWWEAKQPDKGRSLKRRIQHAVGCVGFSMLWALKPVLLPSLYPFSHGG